MEKKEKKIVAIFLILCLIFIALGFTAYYTSAPKISPENRWSQEYIPEQGNCQGSVDKGFFLSKGNEFEIGATKNGLAVFKDPEGAFNKIKSDYKEGLKLIEREFDLRPFSRYSFFYYGTFGWQAHTGSEQEQEQAFFITSFVSIYENSFGIIR